jgi:hypothetical protein
MTTKMKNFADTFFGKIFIGITIALGSALIASVVTYFGTRNAPPQVFLAPLEGEIEALHEVSFSAEGSRDPGGGPLSFQWRLNGLPLGENPAGQCKELSRPDLISCRFILPGTHSVSLEAQNRSGRMSAITSSITVIIDGGYATLAIDVEQEDDREALERAMLHGVDWISVQKAIGNLPIVIYNPYSNRYVYAASILENKERAQEILVEAGFGHGHFAEIRLATLRMPNEALEIIQDSSRDIGLNIEFFEIQFGQFFMQADRDQFDGGLFFVDRPSALLRLRNPNRD